MSMQTMIAGYAQYNYWANARLCQWLLSLDRTVLDRRTASSFPTVALTIRHMQQSQLFWLGIIAKRNLDVPIEPPEMETDLGQLLVGSRLMVTAFTEYTEAALSEEIESLDLTRPRYEFMLHAINHNTYHRGQIVTMCRSLGASDNVPAMDYEVFLWSKRSPL